MKAALLALAATVLAMAPAMATPPPVTVAIAMFVATVKSFLVAGYFMHLLSEKKMIYSILAVTVFFFIGLMGLTLWGSSDHPKNTQAKTLYVP